jgi:phenylalanyl-tRNA synthetase beta subunit
MMAPAVPDHLQRSTLGPAMRSYLIDRGCVECRTTVQTSPEMIDAVGHAAIRLKNPLGLEYSALRTSLIPNLVLVAGRNLRHGADTVRIVEQGKVMTAEATSDFGIREDERIGIVLAGAAEQHWSGATRNLDFYDVTGLVVDTVARAGLHDVVLQPDTAEITGSVWSDNRLAIMRGTERIGTVGQVEPGFVATADIDVAVFAAEWTVRTPLPAARTYNAVGAYPAVRRDVAFVVDDAVTAGDIMATVRQASTDLVRNIDVFDVYRASPSPCAVTNAHWSMPTSMPSFQQSFHQCNPDTTPPSAVPPDTVGDSLCNNDPIRISKPSTFFRKKGQRSTGHSPSWKPRYSDSGKPFGRPPIRS